jgi:hypothetical protein
MKKTILITSLIFLTTLFINSCSKDGSTEENTSCDGVAKTWSDVSPVIQTYCAQAACHEAGSTNGVGPLTNYTEVFDARTRIRDAVKTGLMPQNTTLTTPQKNTIICWIDSGAPNN